MTKSILDMLVKSYGITPITMYGKDLNVPVETEEEKTKILKHYSNEIIRITKYIEKYHEFQLSSKFFEDYAGSLVDLIKKQVKKSKDQSQIILVSSYHEAAENVLTDVYDGFMNSEIRESLLRKKEFGTLLFSYGFDEDQLSFNPEKPEEVFSDNNIKAMKAWCAFIIKSLPDIMEEADRLSKKDESNAYQIQIALVGERVRDLSRDLDSLSALKSKGTWSQEARRTILEIVLKILSGLKDILPDKFNVKPIESWSKKIAQKSEAMAAKIKSEVEERGKKLKDNVRESFDAVTTELERQEHLNKPYSAF